MNKDYKIGIFSFNTEGVNFCSSPTKGKNIILQKIGLGCKQPTFVDNLIQNYILPNSIDIFVMGLQESKIIPLDGLPGYFSNALTQNGYTLVSSQTLLGFGASEFFRGLKILAAYKKDRFKSVTFKKLVKYRCAYPDTVAKGAIGLQLEIIGLDDTSQEIIVATAHLPYHPNKEGQGLKERTECLNNIILNFSGYTKSSNPIPLILFGDLNFRIEKQKIFTKKKFDDNLYKVENSNTLTKKEIYSEIQKLLLIYNIDLRCNLQPNQSSLDGMTQERIKIYSKDLIERIGPLTTDNAIKDVIREWLKNNFNIDCSKPNDMIELVKTDYLVDQLINLITKSNLRNRLNDGLKEVWETKDGIRNFEDKDKYRIVQTCKLKKNRDTVKCMKKDLENMSADEECYELQKKKTPRVPSFCDRVIYDKEFFTLDKYLTYDEKEINLSDHRGIFSTFTFKL